MKRRNFLQLLGAAAGSALIPFKVFGNSYTEPIYQKAHEVRTMLRPSTIYEHNLFLGYTNGEGQYCRTIKLMRAASNVTVQDIVNEFYQKYHDDQALLTTCAVEDNTHLYENMGKRFRVHMRVGQIKEFINTLHSKQMKDFKHNKMVKGKWESGTTYRSRIVDTYIQNRHIITKWECNNPNRKRYSEQKMLIYDIETFASEMVNSRQTEIKIENGGNRFSTKNIRKRLKEDWERSLYRFG